jgi:hypothetical protein
MKTRLLVGGLVGLLIIPIFGGLYYFFGPDGPKIFTMSLLFAAAGMLIATILP